ncbi:MAG: helix-turn-helix transcriptional regulator [Ornithinibacter sp.]
MAPSLDQAHALLAASDWAGALTAFEALESDVGAEALEGAARAAWWLDDGAACCAAWERAHGLHRDGGDVLGAARAAVALGYDSALFGRGASVAQGWLGRARDLLETVEGPTPEHAWLAVREAELALQVTHRLDVARGASERAVALGRALGNTEIELVGMALSGLTDVLAGHLDRGMERLDTAVVGALAGEVTDLMWLGKTCCWLVVACRRAQDLPRALEWCERVDELCRDRDLAPLFTACRIQYASVRLESGHWLEAERELIRALDRMQGSQRTTRNDAVIQLGHLRRRQGRLEEAEQLYAQAGFEPPAVVGRALVNLARGETETAWALVAGVLGDVPAQDVFGRAAILLPVTRCAAAAGDLAAARAAAAELASIADAIGTDAVRGAAAVARALVAEPADVAPAWRAAIRCFHRAGLPVDEADAHLTLARSLVESQPRVAAQEARAAITALADLEAPQRLEEAGALLARLDPTPVDASTSATALTAREVEVLRLVAAGLSSVQIAASLSLSQHTVHRHVANILTRLDQPTRASAVAHAVRAGLL